MSNENPGRTISITKTTIIFGVVLLVLGYFIGNTIPITSNIAKQQPNIGMITSTVGQDDTSTTKFAGSVNFDVPSIAKFRGSESARLNLVEFGDYQCPFCEKFFKETEPILAKEYIDAGKVKFYFLDVSIVGPDSIILAQASWCANDQDKYYEYHDYVYANQGQENSGWGTPDKVKNLVKNISGIDIEKFGQCLDSKKYESRSQQLTSFANQIGLTGTPTMFVGNSELGYTKITGAQPYSVFKQVIDKYLEQT
ncbi:MAG: DsbA family protein [Candidatus Nitrosotenuis sp.]|nr:MAG: DsbA family protein [Candidatus Nitrosotenuis sp.]